MDKFQYYNRNNNQWEDYDLVQGWKENFVLDKTTDNAQIKIKKQGLEMPDFDIGDWCRILHLSENETGATYTAYELENGSFAYIPKNNEQYFIKNFQMVEDAVNDEIDIQLDLGEPIELTNGIVCETMSFTNQIEKTVDNKKYIHEPLNHYSVLEKILKVTPCNNDIQKSWFSRIKIIDKAFLQNLPFNDETYSEPTLYNILLDKYDSNVGRTPVIYFDIDGETDKPFNVNRTEYVLKFERQDGFDKEIIELDELVNNGGEIIKNKTFSNFAQGIVCNFDNLSPSERTTFVSETLWAVPEIDSDERSLTTYTESDANIGKWIIKVPHKIKRVISIKRLNTNYYYNNIELARQYHRLVRDIEEEIKCVSKKEYNALAQYPSKTVDWYEEGDNKIHLTDYYYKSGTGENVGNYFFIVEYEPLISGRVEDVKDFQTIINQSDSQVDSEKFGKYLENYLKSMNKADYIISKTVENWGDIKEIGSRVIDNAKNYLITNVSIENRGFDYNITYQLNENHLRKNDSIVAPQEVRKNIEISIDATKERKTYKSEKAKLSLTNQSITNTIAKADLFNSLLDINQTGNLALIGYLNFKGTLTLEDLTTETYSIERLCELSKFILGNRICFNLRYIDNAEAGKYKDSNISKRTSEQTVVLYTNPFGEIEKFDFKILNAPLNLLDEIDINVTLPALTPLPSWFKAQLDITNETIDAITNYPLTTGISAEDIENAPISINDINYYKDMLDIFNFTFGIEYESDNNIILCRHFFKNNSLVGEKEQLQNILISGINTYNENIDENDFANATIKEQATITSSVLSDNEISINFNNYLESAKSIALVDGAGNPVIIINDFDKIKSESFNSLKLYC